MRPRIALLALIAALLGAAWYSGAFRTFSDVDQVRALLDSWGPWAYVFFLGSFTILQPLGVPASFWVLPAAILWPFRIAFPLSLAGALTACPGTRYAASRTSTLTPALAHSPTM